MHRVISMFSGCGGLDLGFLGGFKSLNRTYERLPFEIVWANERNPHACNTYRHNINHPVIQGDVWTSIHSMPAHADVIVGGFPCQDISINNHKGAGVAGARSGLYAAMVQAVRNIRPTTFVAENVRGLLMPRHRRSLHKVVRDFSIIGYKLNVTLYNSANYAVPQTRERVFIIGTKDGSFQPPPPVTPKEAWVTAESAIADLIPYERNEAWSHVWSEAKRSPQQGSRRLKADRPGYTIRAEWHGNTPYHYALDRRISMREAARIQSFPDDFLFKARLRETERQIGNAVPPILSWHIASALAQSLS